MVEDELITMKVFYSYASEDQTLRDQLEKHLGNLTRQGIITSWSNRNINAGQEWKKTIQTYLDEADIILLLISSDFFSSDFCYSVELQNALERQRKGEAEVLPILLRPVDWEQSSFSHLPVLPVNAEPINTWPNLDKAFLEVVKGIKESVVRKYLQRGQKLLSREQPEKALIVCEKAIQVNRTAHIAFVFKGDILLGCFNRYEEALIAYQQASELGPTIVEYLIKIGDLLSNKSYDITNLSEDDRKKSALNVYQRLSELEPTNASYLIKTGDLLPARRALAPYQKASELEPTNASYLIKVGDTLLKYPHENHEGALASYRKASALEPTNTSYLNKIAELLWYDLKRLEEALVAYRRASELDPTNASYLVKIGELLRDDLKRPEEALVAYRRASELDPTNSKHYISMVEILSELHRYEEAISVCEQAKEPKNVWSQRMIGDLLVTLHRYEEALVAYQVAYQYVNELEPERASLKSHLQEKIGDIYLNHFENHWKALTAYQQASEDYPREARFQVKIGDILSEHYDREEKYEEALAAYRQASERDASEPSYYEKQAKVLEKWAQKLRKRALELRN
jgi:tetratricopeptide (TPR) repeat protein